MNQNLVTVKTFNLPGDIPVIQSFLGKEGIEVFIKNITTHRLVGPIGDIEMQVRTTDYQQAKEALIEGGFASHKDFKE